MSADNGVYILVTTDNHKRVNEYTTVNTFGAGITAYRVAHCFAIDNLDYAEDKEIHNLGHVMHQYFGGSKVYYSCEEAFLAAQELHDDVGYTEYGISEIDFSEYNFPSH